MNSKEFREGRNSIARELVEMKARLGKLELWKTMHAMEKAVQQVGWELADQAKSDK